MREAGYACLLYTSGCSFLAACINVVFGVILAWTLTRYDFPGKRILDGFIELPFALPTAVAGITLSKMYSDTGIIGKPLAALGIKVAYTHVGLVIALVFVGIPFVVRSVQPILEKLDGQYGEAAYILGATPSKTFFKVILSEMKPAILTGFGLAFARGVGELSLIHIWHFYRRSKSKSSNHVPCPVKRRHPGADGRNLGLS